MKTEILLPLKGDHYDQRRLCHVCCAQHTTFSQGIPLPWQTKRTVFRDRPFPIIVVNKSTRRVTLYINLIGINVIIIIIIIDRLLAVLNRKILTRSRFPDGLKDLEAAYTHSACFKDIYEYLRYNKLPSNPRKAHQTQINANNHFLLGTLLFKPTPNKLEVMNPVLCVPPSKMDLVLDHYHSSLLGGHQGMNKTLMTLQERFFCPRLGDIVRSYIVSCHVCQLFKNSKRFDRPFLQRKYDINQGTMTCISMDIKHMPGSSTGHNYILVMLCEISNFMVTAPMVTATSPEICQVMQDHLICVFGTPVKLFCDQDPAFISHLTQTMLLSKTHNCRPHKP